MRLLEGFYAKEVPKEIMVAMMREDNLTYQEIAKLLDIDRTWLSSFSKELPFYDYPIAQPAKGEANIGNLNCGICSRSVLISKMPARTYEGFSLYSLSICSLCMEANPEENPNLRNSIARQLARKEKMTRAENKATLEQLPYGYFAFLYGKQKGRCFYTDEPLAFNRRSGLKTNISTDRVLHHGEYEQGNIVFCVNYINVVKSNMTLDEMKRWSPKLHGKTLSFLEDRKHYFMESD